MRVAHAFQSSGFNVIRSDFYIDPATREPREVDLKAWVDFKSEQDYTVRIVFLVECKVAKDHPLVVLQSDRRLLARPAAVAQRAANSRGRLLLRSIAQDADFQESPLFNLDQNCGYAVTDAFGKDGNSACYKALTGLSATLAAESKKANGYEGKWAEIYFPIVAIDGLIFCASLNNETGQTSSRQAPFAQLIWRRGVIGIPHAIFHIVSESDLMQFLPHCKQAAEDLIKYCRSNEDKVHRTLV